MPTGDVRRRAGMAVVSVVFDVGETLPDDSREFGAWADWPLRVTTLAAPSSSAAAARATASNALERLPASIPENRIYFPTWPNVQ
jgi:hypothetical protein